jgi:hypothetical protein
MWVCVQDIDGNVIALQNMQGHPIDAVQLHVVAQATSITGLSEGLGVIDFPFDRAHVLAKPSNLDFEESAPRSDWVFWDAREQSTLSEAAGGV